MEDVTFNRMRAIVIAEPGGPEVLRVGERRIPDPGAGEIRVRVRASGINRADLIQRMGHYPAPAGWPEDIPGLEFCGVVEASGPGATRWEHGTPVMGIVGGGGYAEAIVTHQDAVVPVPAGMDLLEAGAIPEVFLTAYDAVWRQTHLQEGETLLIHAVGSGVGTAALQMARALGSRTIGTSRTAWKLERAEELGLDQAVFAGSDWAQQVLESTDGKGVDVILDLVGAPYLEGNQRVLAPQGRHIVVGVTGGQSATIDLRKLMSARATLRGTVLRARPLDEKVALARDFENRILSLFEDERVKPVIDQVLPPERAPEAHQLLEENGTFGKVLLDWGA